MLELNSNLGLYQSSGKGKESCCLLFPSSIKREIRHFHFVVVQRRLRNAQKSVMHVQSCFANLNLFLPFSLPLPVATITLWTKSSNNTFCHFRAPLVPVFSFGENDLYDQVDNSTGSSLRQWQTKVKAYTGVSPVLFYGALGLLPHRRPIHTVCKLKSRC